MIQYYKGAFGLNLLWRFRGSAVYRGMIPGLISVLILLLIRLQWRADDPPADLEHPYAVGVLVSSVSFLIVFRANHGYARYWEACGALHQMMSKWMDATTHTAVYHMQCDHFIHIQPPSYFNHPELNEMFLTRARERHDDPSGRSEFSKSKAIKKSIEVVVGSDTGHPIVDESLDFSSMSKLREKGNGEPSRLRGKSRLDGGWSELFPPVGLGKKSSTYFNADLPWNEDGKGFASTAGGRTPDLFLQELAHLCSLLNAVALSTLRNDIDGAESPLDIYVPGASWPEADPDMDQHKTVGIAETIKYLTGRDRSAEARTAYNASKPLQVIGGVSSAEIRFLQMARGPYAKTQLCWQWLSEFIIREHLAGSTGKVGPPIISRVVQFLSDGMSFYNHARKIMYIPFPFPSAQISVFFVIAVIFAVPLMMDQYATELWLSSLLTFFTVTCLAGLHEVARELENPFRNVPNDLPVTTFQAFFNEALLTMYNGYHPDAYWDPSRTKGGGMPHKSSRAPSSIPEEKGKSKSAAAKESKSVNGAGFVDGAKLQDLIEAQGREIERLRKLVEGDITKGE
jgi:predicted membrane chloride channel (bestrophin family)